MNDRVLVRDAPLNSAASKFMDQNDTPLPTYEELIELIAIECDGMSGASLAGVARAEASRALERAVTDFAGHIHIASEGTKVQNSINDCLVTKDESKKAVEDVFLSAKAEDYEEPVENKQTTRKDNDEAINKTEGKVRVASTSNTMNVPPIAASAPIKSANAVEPLLELNGGYADVSEHESITEFFRAGVEIPDWGGRVDEIRSSSLRDLLPQRKTTWLKLDKFGRRIEDTDAKR